MADSPTPTPPRHPLPSLTAWLLAATTLAGCAGDRAAPERPGAGTGATARPSLVLVVIDTLRRDHLSLHGYPRETSPVLDRLAGESVTFLRARAASSWTQPSTASLLTGLLPARHGAHERAVVAGDVTFLAERLGELGYATAGFSGNVNVSPALGMDQGFDRFEFRGGDRAREYPDVAELVALGENWLTTAPEPFFLYLHVMNVHGPYRAPEAYRERFLEEPWQPFEFQGPLWRSIVRDGELERRAAVAPAHLRDLTARYDGAIAYTDEVLGGFFRRLGEAGRLERTVLVVTSDHGEELFDHGGFGHGFTVHGEVLDVPLLLRLPGGRSGGVEVGRPVGLIDLPATLLELAGAPPQGGRLGDGRSLVPLIAAAGEDGGGGRAEPAPPRALMAELRSRRGRARALQRWPWRLLDVERDYTGRPPRLELYRADVDPGERRDLAHDEPNRTTELRRELDARHARLEALRHDSLERELDPALRERLEALGYVD